MSKSVDLARSLRATIELRCAELATLESTLEIVEANASDGACPGRKARTTGRGIYRRPCLPSPCYGVTFARTCTGCGVTFAQCEEHGGSRSAAYQLKHHECVGDAPEVERVLAAGVVVRDRDLVVHGVKTNRSSERAR